MNFIVNIQEHFQRNSVIHNVYTSDDYLHRPVANLSGIKIFNSLPSSLKSLIKKGAQFKVALKGT
jgi:hypothetical protein